MALGETVFLIHEQFHGALASVQGVRLPHQSLLLLEGRLQNLRDEVLLGLKKLVRKVCIQERDMEGVECTDRFLDVAQVMHVEVEHSS